MGNRAEGNRGASLATTLVFATLALIVGLALASFSVTHLHFSTAQSKRQQAHSAAESVVALTVEKLMSQPDFGADDSTPGFLQVTLGEAIGRVSFDPGQAARWNMDYSTNNQGSNESRAGSRGRELPPESVHVIAVGESGGVRKNLEIVLHTPGFPYALASSGEIQSEGALLIGGLADLTDAFPEIEEEELEPADLASNAPGRAISITGTAQITGNIQAVGQIALGDDVRLKGELKPLSDPVPVSQIDLGDLRPQSSLPLLTQQSPLVDDARHISAPDNLVRISGGLTLDDGILYVDGDLEVSGGVRGHGALLVDGDILIRDGVALAAENKVALVAKGDVDIRGGSRTAPFFQGLVYTEGDFRAQDCTLLGTFVANKPSGSVDPGSRMQLRDVNVVHLPSFGAFETKSKKIQFKINLNRAGGKDAGDARWTEGLTFSFNGDEQKLEEFLIWTKELGNSSTDDYLQRSSSIYAKTQEFGIVVESSTPTDGHNFKPGAIDYTGDHQNNNDVLPAHMFASELAAAARNQNGIVAINDEPIVYEEQEATFQFDLNEFINEVERTRILLWHES